MMRNPEEGVEHSWGYGTAQRLRDDNQDCHGVFELAGCTLGVVCDGMGGHVGGAQASSLAVRTIHDAMRALGSTPPAQAIAEAVQKANLAVYGAAHRNHRLAGMGTTVVAAVLQRDMAVIAHVGDSRAYLVRKGQVHLLTRDHTMVNLFVDAELLSPEDAATHPEAHVLSRSLGVERQVDVEVSEPMQLEPGDVLLLCSDGVHGVVTDWELAKIDWRAPHAGVKQILDIVRTREGDDNASAVALLLGTTVEEVPATPVPEVRRVDDTGPQPLQGSTVVPIDDDLDPGGARSQEEVVIAPPPGAVAKAPEPVRPAVPQAPANLTPAPQVAPGKPVSAAAQPQSASAQRRKWSSVVPVVLAAAALLLVGAVMVVLLMPGDDPATDGVATDVGPGGAETLVAKDPTAAPVAPKPVAPEPVAAADPTAAATCVDDGTLFSPKLPPPPRRLPWRANECTQSPPGGPEQFTAVDAARRHDCREALGAVQGGMRKSIDHCRLYQTAWLCFDESHQRPLEAAKSKTFADAKYQLVHFQGTPEQMASSLTDQEKLLPTWFRPAPDGLEYRLRMWNEDQQMAHFVNDLLGEPKVADVFAKDLHLEALMASGMACEPESERTPAMVEAWARRVYVVARALERDRTGRILNQHRSELVPVLRDLLKTAVSPQTGPNGAVIPVPEMVTEAYEVGLGMRPDPTGKPPAPRIVEKPIVEPEIPDDEGGISVQN